VGHVVHSGGSGNGDALFFMLGWDWYEFDKNAPGHITMKFCFASGGICGSHSALRCIQGTKRQCNIFHARVGLVQI
jgi:hypothetical protein